MKTVRLLFQLAIEPFAVLEAHPEADLSPDCRFYLANIYRVFGFAIQSKNRPEAIRLTEKGHQIALNLVANHPAIPTYQAYVADSNYSRALLPFIGKDQGAAETILLENVELTRRLLEKFPEKSINTKQTLANSLTLVGLIYSNRRQWQQQLTTLQQSLDLVEENIRSRESDFHRILACGLKSEIGFCHVQMGDLDTGVKLLLDSVGDLEKFSAADPRNGMARRYLVNSLDFASEALRRAGISSRRRIGLRD